MNSFLNINIKEVMYVMFFILFDFSSLLLLFYFCEFEFIYGNY